MNKKIFIAATLAIAMCTAWLTGTNGNKSEREIAIEENAEALANGEESGATGSSCGGFRYWFTTPNDEFERAKEFYDCTCTLRSGYEPGGSCN